jgi:hypothetical protein
VRRGRLSAVSGVGRALLKLWAFAALRPEPVARHPGQRLDALGAGCLLGVVRAGRGSGGRWERSGACERGDEGVCPAPRGIDAQRGFAGVKGEPGGDVQQR